MKQNRPPKRILIVKLSAIGDVLMATPVAAAIRKAYPDSYIAWVVERKSADVVIGNPYIDDVIIWERGKVKGKFASALHAIQSFISLKRQMKSHDFDVVLDFQGLIRSAAVCIASGAKRRIGFADAGEFAPLSYHEKFITQTDDLNAQQRNLDLLKSIEIDSSVREMHMPLESDDEAFAERFFAVNSLNQKKVVALLPATTWVNKHWINSGWSQLIDHLHCKYGASALILGSPADIPLAEEISKNSTFPPVIAAGKTTLKQAGALMKRCNAVIGVDTGLLHMAVALDKPSVGLFGASIWRCFLKKENFVWISKDFDCSPCLRHPTCKDVDCMKAIGVEEIDKAISELL